MALSTNIPHVSPQLSVQLYTVRDAFADDAAGTLDRLAAAGLRNVEPYDFVGRAAELRAQFDAAGVAAPSGHAHFLSPDDELWQFERLLDEAQALGMEFVIEPSVATALWASRDDVARTAERLNGLVDAAEARGIQLGYHNHSQEFHHSFDGVSAFETFTGLLDPRAVLEVDVFWAAIGRQDVPTLLRRLGDRVRLLHVKDGVIGDDPHRPDVQKPVRLDQRIAGTGEVPLREVLAAAPATRYAVIEFDEYDGDVLDAVVRSAAFLREAGAR